MTKEKILLFEYYLLAAEVFESTFKEEARQRASGASASGHTDTWHDEVFKMELVQKAMEATMQDQLRRRLLSPAVDLPKYPMTAKEVVDLGAVVTIKEADYPEDEYLLTGDTAVTKFGFITVKSPLGKGLLGLHKNSERVLQFPAGILKLKVLSVSYDVYTLLTRYMKHLYENSKKGIKEFATPERLQELSKVTDRIKKAESRDASLERDYYETISVIVKHTAMLEAILLVIEAYHLQKELEDNCRETIGYFRQLSEKYEIPYKSLYDVDYYHPKSE